MRPLLSIAIRAFFLKAGANLTAQVATRWHADDPVPEPLDRQRVLEFAIYGFCSAQLGFFWHIFLERVFPNRRTLPLEPLVPRKPEKKGDDEECRVSTEGTSANFVEALRSSVSGVRWRNVMAKVFLDQTIGMFCLLSIFLVWTNWFRVDTWAALITIWRGKVLTLLYAGWMIWPWVMTLNFIFVPLEKRQLVSVCIGFCWNVVLSLLTHPDPPPFHH